MTVLQFDAEHRVWKRINDGSRHLDLFFFGQFGT